MSTYVKERPNILERAWTKFRYGLLIQEILAKLSKMGIMISFYYLVEERPSGGPVMNLQIGDDSYQVSYLGPEDMKLIAEIPERRVPEGKLQDRLKEGKYCLGVKYQGQLAGFTWFDLDECNFRVNLFSLKKNEAYLFDVHTVRSFRGKGIAAYLRSRCYQELIALGRTRYYSISQHFNTSSMNLKKKLHAKLLELHLYVELFKKWRFDVRLKKYPDQILEK